MDIDIIKAGLSSQLKESMSDTFLLNDTRTQTSMEVTTQNQQHSSFNKFIATNDPWQGKPQSSAVKVPNDVISPSSSPTNPWAFTNIALSSNVRGGTENQVVLNPWSSSVKRDNIAAKLPSTNPWAKDVTNVDIIQSIVSSNAANGSLHTEMSKELNSFEAGQNGESNSTQKSQGSSDLFENWDVAVRQMYQSPSCNSVHRYGNPWS